MSLAIQYGQSISFVGGAEGTTTASLPAHAKDDVILAFSYRNGSLTPPTLPSGWTSIATESHEDGGSQASARVAYRVATDGSTPAGSWTNADITLWGIYRGVSVTSPIVQCLPRSGAANAVRYYTMYDTLATSWVATFAGHNVSDFNLTSGYDAAGWITRRYYTPPSGGHAASSDEGGPTGGGMSAGLTAYHFGTEAPWVTARVELRSGAGEREFGGYRMLPRARAFAVRHERSRGGGVRAIGDRLEDPAGLTVTVTVASTSLRAAYELARTIITEAETASLVTLHAGAFQVAGLASWGAQPVGDAIDLTLSFARAAADDHQVIEVAAGVVTAAGSVPTVAAS